MEVNSNYERTKFVDLARAETSSRLFEKKTKFLMQKPINPNLASRMDI